MAEKIIFRYVAERNPQRAFLPGVPLRDLTAADVAELPAWLLPGVAAAPFYVAADNAEFAEEVENG